MANTEEKKIEQKIEHSTKEELQQEIERLREDMRSLVTTVKDIGYNKVEKTRNKAEEELDELLERLSETYGAIKREGRRSANKFKSEVGDNPLASVGISFLVGLVIGKLLSSK